MAKELKSLFWYLNVDRHLLRLFAPDIQHCPPSSVPCTGTRPRHGSAAPWHSCGWWWCHRTWCTGWCGGSRPARWARRPGPRWWWGVGRPWPHTSVRTAPRGWPPSRWRMRRCGECHLQGARSPLQGHWVMERLSPPGHPTSSHAIHKTLLGALLLLHMNEDS